MASAKIMKFVLQKMKEKIQNLKCVFREHPDTHYGSIRTA